MDAKKVLLAGLILLAFLSAVLPGQSMNAKIVGTVKDEEGTCLSGVTVTAMHIGKNAETTCSSEKGGMFRLLGLTPGSYQVSFDLQGYQSYVAAGLSLTVEQSITLRVKLKKNEPSTNMERMASDPTTRELSEHMENMRSYQDWGRFSLNLSYSMNYMAVGDSNAYLRAFSSRAAGRLIDSFESLHGGNDLNAEISYRITPRLEIGLGMGQVTGHMRNNDLISLPFSDSRAISDEYSTSLNVRAIPLQLICRYGLGHNNSCFYSLFGAILYNFATWRMDSRYWRTLGHWSYSHRNDMSENASGNGFGVMAGVRAEVVLEENFALTFDFSGRFAPLRNFSGRRKYTQSVPFNDPQDSSGKLWFFEYYDKDQGKWVWDLGIGERPAGPETRNVSSAKVDFSGLALRVGVLFKF